MHSFDKQDLFYFSSLKLPSLATGTLERSPTLAFLDYLLFLSDMGHFLYLSL